MDEHGVDMLVAAADVRYLAPLHFDEEFELVVTVPRIGETSTTTRVVVEREGSPVAEVEVRHVFVDATSRTKTALPDAVRRRLADFAA